MTKKQYEYRIKVRLDDGTITEGRPTGGHPYRYLMREHAEKAAQLWGDGYLRGDVWAEKVEY